MNKLNKLVGVLLVLFLVLPYFVPTFSATGTASQLLYVKHWYGATYYFYNDKVVVMDSSGDNITLYNELGAIVSKLNLTSYQLLISRNNVTYYYNIDVKLFGKTYTFKILIMFLFSETGTCKIKVVIDLPFRIPKWIGKALFKWRLPGEFKQHGYRLVRKRLFIDFSDMVKHGKFGKFVRGKGYIEVESVGFNSGIIIDPVIGVVNGTTSTPGSISYYTYVNALSNPGFETGDLTGWTAYDALAIGGVNVTSTYAYSGSYSAVMYVPSATTDDVWLRQNLTVNYLVHSITIHYYVVDPFGGKFMINLYKLNPLTLVWQASLNQSVTNTWLTFQYNFSKPIEVGFIEIWGETNSDTTTVYVDDVCLDKYSLIRTDNTLWNGTYIAYSASNATYTYNITTGNVTLTSGYYIPITISTTLASPVHNYSLRLNLTALGFTGWSYTAENGSDIYFLDANGNPLYYWIETYNATTQQGIIWVNTTLTNTTIYMYYGETTNPYASYNDPNRVFLWYDTQGDPSKYSISQITGTATWSQDTTGNPAPSLKATYSTGGEQIAYPSNINSENIAIEADVKGSSYTLNVQPTIGVRYIVGQGIIEFRIHPGGATGTSAGIDYKDIASGTDNFLWSTSAFTLDTSVWYHVVGIAYGDKVRMLVYANGNLLADSGWVSTTWTSSGYAGAVYVDGSTGTSIWWDNIRIYKYVDPTNYSVSLGAPVSLPAYPDAVNITMLLPSGYDIVNITRSDGVLVDYTIVQYNSTYVEVYWLDSYGYNYTLYATAWNSISVITADYKYYPYGYNATIYAKALDPYQNPLANYTIIFQVFVNGTYEYNTTALTNSTGWANTTIALPASDAEISIQAILNQTYIGVRNTTIYTTSYKYNISYTPGTIVRKNNPITLVFTVTRTVDGSKPDGWLYIYFNSTTLESEVRTGYTSRIFNSSLSGEWNLTVLKFIDSESPSALIINKNSTLVWCGVDISYSIYPVKYYYSVNETITINYYVAYDTGQTRNWTINVYQNGVKIYTSIGYTGSFNVNLTNNNNITISVLELDGKNTVKSFELIALYININGYVIHALNGTNILYVHAGLSEPNTIIGAYVLAVYSGLTNKTIHYYEDPHYTIQLFFAKINDTAIKIDMALTNLLTTPEDYNISFTIKAYYLGGIIALHKFKMHVEPYRTNYTSFILDLGSYQGILYYDLNISMPSYTKLYEDNLPFIVGDQLYENVRILKGFSKNSEINLILGNIASPNTTLIIMTPVGLISRPAHVDSTINILFKAEMDTNTIYESGMTANITVNVTQAPFPMEVQIVFAGNSWTYQARNTTYTITIPDLPAYVLETYPVQITLLVSGIPVKQYTYTIMVYNSGPKIMLISPSEYSQINGTVTITLYVYDPSGVESVLWKWDFEDSWHNASLDGYYAYITYDTLKIQNGLARLMVKATDKHGYVSDAVYYFNIYNPVNEARMNQLLYNIGQFVSRFIFIPGLITGILTTVIGMWIGYAFRKRREKQEKIVVVLNQKGVKQK
ncbi:MAG: DUF2341 domain-containing protein [Crenarchaeota archaeon]|nr:DUF2341 domain-containing protein [Thermoproteota archaeon]